MSGAAIRLLVADDHVVVRLGLVTLVESQSDMHVVAQAATGPEVLEQYRAHRPDVVLMDLRMPGPGGPATIRSLHAQDPSVRVLVLTVHKGRDAAYQALCAGARGYLLKDAPCQEIVAAIRAVHAGGRSISSEIAGRVAERIRCPDLSPREIAALKLAASGLSNRQAAERLSLSPATVKNQLASAMSKLGTHDRTHAVTVALERGLLDLEELSDLPPADAPGGDEPPS